MQQQLKELNFDKPAFAHCPALLGTRPETPEYEQFESTREDAEEDEGNATSALDAKLDVSMDASGHPARTPSADRYRRRNRTLRRERNRAQREFCRPKNRHLSFPLFRETKKEDAISYRDWRSEIEDALE